MLQVLEQGTKRRRAAARPAAAPAREEKEKPGPLRCSGCRAVITWPSALFPMRHASPVQVFPNPAGVLFEILTVRRATGLRLVGPATDAFTWFPGYAWQIACCQRCGAHLGWRYTATADAAPAVFYGLIRHRLVEDAG